MKERIAKEIAASLGELEEIVHVEVSFDAMGARQRGALAAQLGGASTGEPYFADGKTAVIAVASGKAAWESRPQR